VQDNFVMTPLPPFQCQLMVSTLCPAASLYSSFFFSYCPYMFLKLQALEFVFFLPILDFIGYFSFCHGLIPTFFGLP